MKTITVRVTKDHIARGRRGSCNMCPVALALQETYPAAEVNPSYWSSSEYGTARRLPSKATEFIGRFDRALAVTPFSFRLEVPE